MARIMAGSLECGQRKQTEKGGTVVSQACLSYPTLYRFINRFWQNESASISYNKTVKILSSRHRVRASHTIRKCASTLLFLVSCLSSVAGYVWHRACFHVFLRAANR